jgi:hypothetical membrane protein
MEALLHALSAPWRWLLGAGVVAPVVMLAATVAAAAKYPGFSHRASFVNELGTTASPKARWFNGGVAAAGVLMGLYAGGLWLVLGAPVVTAGVAVLALGTLLMGVFPCEPGCPPSPATPAGRVHTGAGVVAALGAVVASLAMGFWAADQAGTWALTLYSLITGGAGLALLFTTLGAIGTGFEGLLQRIFLLAVLAWVAVGAVWLYLGHA